MARAFFYTTYIFFFSIFVLRAVQGVKVIEKWSWLAGKGIIASLNWLNVKNELVSIGRLRMEWSHQTRGKRGVIFRWSLV